MAAVKYLLEEHGADINMRDWWGYAPLHYAASRGDNELIRYMVEQGADVTAVTRDLDGRQQRIRQHAQARDDR